MTAFVPTYYELGDASDLRDVADEYAMYTHVRLLARDTMVAFTQDDPDPDPGPDPLFPDSEDAAGRIPVVRRLDSFPELSFNVECASVPRRSK